MRRIIKISVLLPVLILATCSPQKRMELLSFFFDGVPRTEKDTIQQQADSIQYLANGTDSLLNLAPAVPSMFYHKPYLEKKCMDCHDKNAVADLLKPEPDLCYTCHDDYSKKFKTLHGPVDAGFCTVCHLPHMSSNKGLLSAPGNEHCFPCHITYEVKQPPDHVEIGTKLCVTCHDPHGIKDIIPRN